VREGIRMAGGIAFEFPVHPIQETGKRPTAALDRNLAYLGLVEVLYGYPLDGVVLMTGCDKTTPALHHGGRDREHPSIVLSGGPMLNGWWKGERCGSGMAVWKAREEMAAGRINQQEFVDIAAASAPSVGHCNTMGTASTMNALAEALGMSLPGLRRDPRAVQGARAVRLRDRPARGRDGVGRPEAVRHSHARGVREHHHGELGDRRLDQCADPHQRDRAPHRRETHHRGLGEGRLRHPAAGEHAAGRQVPRRRVLSRGRPARRDERAAQGRAPARERHHGERQDHGRERAARQDPGRRT
jgi:dihydroxy-acid dehydratase